MVTAHGVCLLPWFPAKIDRSFESSHQNGKRRMSIIRLSFAILLLAGASPLCQPATAGISPHNVLVVINADSESSMTIANHYIALRDIPAINVLYLSNIPKQTKITLPQFRDQILKPVVQTITDRRLGNQIRVVAYSSDFPTAIDISAHQKRIADPTLKRLFTPTASLTGLTFHFRHVLEDSEGYLGVTANWYARMPFGRFFTNPFIGPDGDTFKSALADIEQAAHADAAKKLIDLFDRNPLHHPIAVMAAEQFAASNQSELAIQALQQAVQSGWTSGEHLRQSTHLAKLAEDARFKKLIEPLSSAPIDVQPPLGFVGDKIWSPSGIALPSGAGMNYLLSTMLAVTGPHGMTTEQAIENLKRSATADLTYPNAVVYFSSTSDVRTEKRQPGFPAAIHQLSWLGRRSRVIKTAIPDRDLPAIGATIGTAGFRWRDSKTELVPGAIADNLTSYGGVMDQPGQTKLTELLNAGAAMSSGTVAEPYAVQIKFPDPMVHAHYAAGATAIEAFYMSVTAPYQLLIAGDPLCRPMAKLPDHEVNVAAVDPSQPGQFEVRFEALKDAAPSKFVPPASVEFFVDGRFVGRQMLADHPIDEVTGGYQPLRVNLGDVGDGVHEIRTSVVAGDAMAQSTTVATWVTVESKHNVPVASEVGVAQGDVPARKVRVKADGADRVAVRIHGRTIAIKEGADGEFAITPAIQGSGPLKITPIAIHGTTIVTGREVFSRQ